MTDRDSSRETAHVPVDHAFVCHGCDRRWYYTRRRCPDCSGREVSTYELATGELVGWTESAVTPADVRQPNRLGLARFGEVQLVAQLAEDVPIGSRVEFAGTHRLRADDETGKPRLVTVDQGSD